MNPSKLFKAETDLLVFKCLDHYDSLYQKKVLCTPYQYTPIEFDGNGMCIIESEIEKTRFCNTYAIIRGVHAYYMRWKGVLIAGLFKETKMRCHWAIIPKGSEYYIGDEQCIVSNKLIIFKSKVAFDKYKKSAGEINTLDEKQKISCE